jgi:hypothetical protein
MNIDEFAHALGVVFGRAPLGELDLAPRPIDVEDDEEIDGTVAAVLVVETFELPRLGWDRLAHLADELDRALVETNHRALRIRCFGIEVENVFHAGDIFAVDAGNAPHVLAPGLEAVATSRASSLPVSLRSAPGRGSSLSARSRFPSTKRRLVRYTVDPLTATAQAISSSLLLASAASRMICARLELANGALAFA